MGLIIRPYDLFSSVRRSLGKREYIYQDGAQTNKAESNDAAGKLQT